MTLFSSSEAGSTWLHGRLLVPGTALIVAAVLAVSALAPGSATAAPNVVVVMTDDLDVASMHVMTSTRRLLAQRGTNFVNSFVTTPRSQAGDSRPVSQ